MNNPTFEISPVNRPGGLRDNVATTLIASIINGSTRRGDRLIVQKLAASLGVSATPVREALVQLAEIGLVELVPNKGGVCGAFGLRELREVFQMRRILEAEAARSACGRLDEETVERLRHEWRTIADDLSADGAASERFIAQDEALHDYIAANCGSERLAHEIRRYNVLMREIRRYVGNVHGSQLRAAREHVEILEALARNDGRGAAEAMSEHIDCAVDGIESAMFPESAQTDN